MANRYSFTTNDSSFHIPYYEFYRRTMSAPAQATLFELVVGRPVLENQLDTLLSINDCIRQREADLTYLQDVAFTTYKELK